MPYPELTYFKLFVYASGVLKLPHTFEEFVELIQPLELPTVFDRISKAYATGASVEIWDDKVLDDLLFQIKYMDDLKCFKKRSSLELLLEQLEKLLRNFQATVKKGSKAEGGTLEFFRNQTLNRLGYMIMEHSDGKRVNIKLNAINSISTDHPHFIEESEKWCEAAVNSSMGMGVGAKREFSLYFQKLQNQIDELKIALKLEM